MQSEIIIYCQKDCETEELCKTVYTDKSSTALQVYRRKNGYRNEECATKNNKHLFVVQNVSKCFRFNLSQFD